jgi:hypothetical protein
MSYSTVVAEAALHHERRYGRKCDISCSVLFSAVVPLLSVPRRCLRPCCGTVLTLTVLSHTVPRCAVVCCVQLGAVVGEKEVGLVTALRLMGLRQSAYWTSWVVADLLLGFLTALSIVIWGKATL